MHKPELEKLGRLLFRPGEEKSGKLVLRIPRSLHYRLDEERKKEGVSLNQYITMILSQAVGFSERGDTATRETPAAEMGDNQEEAQMLLPKVYGSNKRSYMVTASQAGWIRVWVCHDNESVKDVLRAHKDDSRYFVAHLSTYEHGTFRAYKHFSNLIHDFRSYFENQRVELIVDANCDSLSGPEPA